MTHRDDSGNVQGDFVWGNFPMQPDDDRTDNYYSFGGGSGDNGWDSTWQYTSDTLRISPYYENDFVQELFETAPIETDHVRADIGWSNFPGYIPNYEGDEDSGLETVVPDVLRKTVAQAEDILDAANLDIRMQYHNPSVFYLESTGTTVRAYVYDENAAGGGSPQAYLVGLKVGDKVYVDNTEVVFNDGNPVTITAVNEDGEDSWIEFTTAEDFDPALDTSASGTVWPGPDLVNVVTVMRYWNQPGDIKDEGTNIYLRGLGD
jgi:hypothetical protein